MQCKQEWRTACKQAELEQLVLSNPLWQIGPAATAFSGQDFAGERTGRYALLHPGSPAS